MHSRPHTHVPADAACCANLSRRSGLKAASDQANHISQSLKVHMKQLVSVAISATFISHADLLLHYLLVPKLEERGHVGRGGRDASAALRWGLINVVASHSRTISEFGGLIPKHLCRLAKAQISSSLVRTGTRMSPGCDGLHRESRHLAP